MGRHVYRLTALIHVRHHFFIGRSPLFRIFNGLQFFAVTQLHRTLKTHATELASRPGYGKEGCFKAAACHCLRT